MWSLNWSYCVSSMLQICFSEKPTTKLINKYVKLVLIYLFCSLTTHFKSHYLANSSK